MIDTNALLAAGKLEQMCPNCGRWEAAGPYCSWCGKPTGPDTWYRNNDEAERAARLPSVAPANPPSEYRRTYRPHKGEGWPPQWGPNPFVKGSQPVGRPPKPRVDPENRLGTPDDEIGTGLGGLS